MKSKIVSVNKQPLNEMKLVYEPVDDLDKYAARKFQAVCQVILDFVTKVRVKYTGNYLDDYLLMKDQLSQYSQAPWFKKITVWQESVEEKLEEIRKSLMTVNAKSSSNMDIVRAGMAALGSREDFLKFSKQYGIYQADQYVADLGYKAAFHRINPFHKETSFLSINRDVVETFTLNEMQELIAVDLDNKYTAYPFPHETEDHLLVVFWFNSLKDGQDEEIVDTRNLRHAVSMRYQNNTRLKELYGAIHEYLRDGNRSDLQKAMQILPEFPELHSRNEESKREIQKVYRGIRWYPDDYDDEGEYPPMPDNDEVLAQDLKAVTVSTSRHFGVAYRFAVHHGQHLFQQGDPTPGWVITYGTSPGSIVLDTAIFGGIFDEGEIVIIPAKSRVEAIQFQKPPSSRDNEYEWDDEE